MSDPHGHSTPSLPFTDDDLAEFRSSDVGAGAAVVLLMSAIFTIGLILYTIVALTVAS